MATLTDFLILSSNFGMAGTAAEGDLDNNGQVGFPDFLVLSANFGKAAGAETSSVPEPSGLALFAFVGFVGLLRRRGRND